MDRDLFSHHILHSNMVEQSLDERLVYISCTCRFSYYFSGSDISQCRLLVCTDMRTSEKLCVHPSANCKSQLQIYLFMDLGPGIAAAQNFSFSVIFSVITAWPRAPQTPKMRTLFRISYFLLHFLSLPSPTSFLFAYMKPAAASQTHLQ